MKKVNATMTFAALLTILGATALIGDLNCGVSISDGCQSGNRALFWSNVIPGTGPAMVLFGSGLISIAIYAKKKLKK